MSSAFPYSEMAKHDTAFQQLHYKSLMLLMMLMSNVLITLLPMGRLGRAS